MTALMMPYRRVNDGSHTGGEVFLSARFAGISVRREKSVSSGAWFGEQPLVPTENNVCDTEKSRKKFSGRAQPHI